MRNISRRLELWKNNWNSPFLISLIFDKSSLLSVCVFYALCILFWLLSWSVLSVGEKKCCEYLILQTEKSKLIRESWLNSIPVKISTFKAHHITACIHLISANVLKSVSGECFPSSNLLKPLRISIYVYIYIYPELWSYEKRLSRATLSHVPENFSKLNFPPVMHEKKLTFVWLVF